MLTLTKQNGFDRFEDTVPKISRLVDLAKSGDVDSFIQLYDAYVEGIYRSVYLRVINESAAESITLQVFCEAWEHLVDYQKYNISFSTWIYGIARNLVADYYKTNKKKQTVDVGFLSIAAFHGLNENIRGMFGPEDKKRQVRFLTTDQQQTLISKYINTKPNNKNIAHITAYLNGDDQALQMRTLQTLAMYLEDLDLEREVKPSPTFIAYTRSWLARSLQYHPPRPQSPSPAWQISLAFTALIVALLVTGTAHAQAALPGEPFYGWKRTSEQAWRTLSPDPVGTDIMLADRRLHEWIAVKKDPARSANAMRDYYDVLTDLKPAGDAKARARILPMLTAQKQTLSNAGLSTIRLNEFLVAAANPGSSVPSGAALADITATATAVPTKVSLHQKDVPTEAPPQLPPPPPPAPPATDIPTQVPPPTDVPTQAPPPTDIPTQAPPPTEAPTEAPPPSEAPTEAPPPATEAPPAVPTDVAPPAAPTDVPVDMPTDAVP